MTWAASWSRKFSDARTHLDVVAYAEIGLKRFLGVGQAFGSRRGRGENICFPRMDKPCDALALPLGRKCTSEPQGFGTILGTCFLGAMLAQSAKRFFRRNPPRTNHSSEEKLVKHPWLLPPGLVWDRTKSLRLSGRAAWARLIKARDIPFA